MHGRLAEFASWEKGILKVVMSDEHGLAYGLCEQSSLLQGALSSEF